jgi:hypothetical protein
MRTLSIAEVGDVAGGFALDEVVVTASKYGFWDWGSSWAPSRRAYIFMDTFGADSYSGGGGGGDESGIKGYPVDLDPHSIKDSVDYEKAWKAVFDKMTPAELKAFDAQLERDYKNAMDKYNFKLAEFLFGFKDANGNPSKMGMASSYAAQNASPFTLGLIEAALARAYAVAAALPGGI